MKKPKSYENFPLRIVLLSNTFSTAIYLIGLYVFFQLSIFFAFLYLIYIILMEYRLLKSCRNCYYYGKFCAFGRGKCSALIFKKGNPKLFNKRDIKMKDLLPDLLVSIFPMVGAILILITNFSWFILILLLILVILTSAGNAFIRGSYACKYCKQREKGCPAEKLFKKKK